MASVTEKFIREAAREAAKQTVSELQRNAGRARMRKLTKAQRREFARQGGLASGRKRGSK